jgi:hypothetical protein
MIDTTLLSRWIVEEMEWDVPTQFKKFMRYKLDEKKHKEKPHKTESDIKSWWIKNIDDPEPEHFQEWYTPARYFTREFIKNDVSLRNNKKALLKKIYKRFQELKIHKRGGKEPPSELTIDKALHNVVY